MVYGKALRLLVPLVSILGSSCGGGHPGADSRAPACARGAPECDYLVDDKVFRSLAHTNLDHPGWVGMEHTADGKVLRFWNYGRTKALVLVAGQGGKLVETPPGAFLNRENSLVCSCKDCSVGELIFPGGRRMTVAAFVVDADGRYLCVGGRYYDYKSGSAREAAITIRSLDAPETVLAKSNMRGTLWKSFCSRDRLYLFVRSFGEEGNEGAMNGEVYAREEGKLRLEGEFAIRSPLAFGRFVVVEDICPDERHALLYVKRDLPLSSRRFLMDMRSKAMRDLGPATTQRYAGFLSPALSRKPVPGE